MPSFTRRSRTWKTCLSHWRGRSRRKRNENDEGMSNANGRMGEVHSAFVLCHFGFFRQLAFDIRLFISALVMNLQRILSVGRKEVIHIFRDPQTLFFTLFIPIMEMFLLGYAIDTNVRHIRTVVFDVADTQESRDLLRQFENSQDLRIVRKVFSDEDMTRAIVSGEARVGIKIPADYSRRLEAGETAQVLVLVDGTESTVAAEAVNVGNALALRQSLMRVLGSKPLPVEARPRILFNPDTRSANFFIPGLMV